MRRHALAALFVATAFASPLRASPVHWPNAERGRVAVDPIGSIRWASEPWTDDPNPQIAAAARMLESAAASPRTLAQRAVVERLQQRFDDARASIDQAVGRDPHVLDDPDVALTDAFLLARAGDLQHAVDRARAAFPRVEAPREQTVALILEVARWSMARGPDGVATAIDLLRELTFTSPEPIVRATLALALDRAGRAAEATEVARGGPLPSPYATLSSVRRGALFVGDAEAAVGVALLLAGRGPEAAVPLARAVAHVAPVWRPSAEAALAASRRTPAPAPASSGHRFEIE